MFDKYFFVPIKQPEQNFLSTTEVLALQKAHRLQREKRLADRYKAILYLNKGLTFEQTAELLMLDDNTVRSAYELYSNKGIESLSQFNYVGGSSYLSSEEYSELSLHLEEKLYCHSKEIKQYVLEKYGIEYTVEGIRKVLKNMGFVYKKTKHLPGKGDIESQLAFEKSYRKLKRKKAAEDEIYFMDGVHPLHNSVNANGWIKKGQERAIESNTGRQRININGACNAATGDVIINECESVNAQSTIELFEKMKVHQPSGKLYIIADNAKYYCSNMVKLYLKNNKRIKLIHLPPYSPNLNLIERLWKFYKKEIVYNKYYPDFSKFKNATLQYFEKIDQRKEQLRKLLNDKFYFPILNFPKPKLV